MENRSVIDKVINSTGSVSQEHRNDNIFSCFSHELRTVLHENGVTEIMINGIKNIYIEKNGLVCELDFGITELDIHRFIDSVAQYNSRNIDFNHPIFDGKLPGGFRCNIVMQPVSLDGVTITLRKHTHEVDSFAFLLNNHTLDNKIADVLKNAVDEKLNVIIAGGTGTGKTTLVNVLLNSLSGSKNINQRIITIEDTAELKLKLPHVIRLESRYSTPDCPYEVSIRDLVKTALRMRPDRIIIGEVRGEEAYDLLHAVNTGHRGSICTIHANSCRDALRRFETLAILGHPNLDISIPRSWIASNINLLVHIARVENLRKVVEIKRIEGVECGNYILHDLI
ncbi:MAG: ATPase, T2SS/T4P/T4SS family [Proteobacteria bacterium]|nr:ATPase, T2SS/T4P/T4SS family [Pseudomonadota bacterium]